MAESSTDPSPIPIPALERETETPQTPANAFLRPLSFPEPHARTKDLSHFLYPSRDVPIVCPFPTCSDVFGSTCNYVREEHKQESFEKNDSVTPETTVHRHHGLQEGESNNERSFEANRTKGGRVVTPGHDVKAFKDGGDEGVSGGVGNEKPQFGPKDEWLRHLFLYHKMVIDKVQEIGSLKSYSLYWRERFSQAPITEFAAVIKTNDNNKACYDTPDHYYLLSDALPEDRQLRTQLQHKKLEAILLIQQKEREDTSFSRSCLFCSHVFTGNRSVLFQHMLDTHSFNIGQPDNLVFVNEFLDLLQQKLDNLQCLFCEKTFRDYNTLKDHMRKKQHKKISGNNRAYDRFYAINYLQSGKSWEEVQAEDDREILPQAGGESETCLKDHLYPETTCL